MASLASKGPGRTGSEMHITLWVYRVACLCMLLYITAMESSGRTLLRQVQLTATTAADEAAALRLCAANGWVDPNATAPVQPPACPACECRCEAAACPQCPEVPGPEAVAAAKEGPHPPQTTFCPWSARYSVFDRHEVMVDFGRGESVCADAIIYGYDLMFEHWGMWRQMFWLGVPTEQDPSDFQVIQELLWDLRPDVVIELGTNTGGGALAMASVMHLIEQATQGTEEHKRMRIITIDPRDFHDPAFPGDSCTPEKPCKRPDTNPLWSKYVKFIQGVPPEAAILEQVRGLLKEWNATTVLVSEDSSHAHGDVLSNIRAYQEFVTVGSYLLVQDTKLTRMWKSGGCSEGEKALGDIDNCYREGRVGPLDAIEDFLKEQPEGTWQKDKTREYLAYTQHADGWLKRLK